MRFTKVNTVNLFLTLHVLRITDDHFILSRISMLEINKIGLEYYTDLRKNVKRILGVIVGLLKDRVSTSEEPANKKRRVEAIIKKK